MSYDTHSSSLLFLLQALGEHGANFMWQSMVASLRVSSYSECLPALCRGSWSSSLPQLEFRNLATFLISASLGLDWKLVISVFIQSCSGDSDLSSGWRFMLLLNFGTENPHHRAVWCPNRGGGLLNSFWAVWSLLTHCRWYYSPSQGSFSLYTKIKRSWCAVLLKLRLVTFWKYQDILLETDSQVV